MLNLVGIIFLKYFFHTLASQEDRDLMDWEARRRKARHVSILKIKFIGHTEHKYSTSEIILSKKV